jgi:hypothetical protein
MAKLAIKKASTDVTTYVFIQDSSKTTGVGLAGLAYNTTDLVASYVRPLGTRQALTLATLAAADSAHSDGGFKEIDATNMPGVYRLDLPDAVCATGVPSVVVMLKGATNMSPVVLEIQLTDFDLNTAAITAAAIADAVWDEAISGHTTGTTFGGKNQKVVPSETVGDYKADVSGLALEATLTAIKGAGWTNETLAAIKSAIDALSSGGVDPAVIAAAILDALLADHTVAGSVAKTIADILEDTGTTLSNLITSIKSKTDLMDASAITYTPNVVGTDITLLRGDTFSATLTDVGALTGYVSIDFTVKRNTSNTDDEAVIRIRKNASGTGDGLLRLNRAAPTTETGEIVIDDEATGDITITLDETATDSLEIGAYLYDVQLITATAVKTLTSGRLNVTSDVTRAIA